MLRYPSRDSINERRSCRLCRLCCLCALLFISFLCLPNSEFAADRPNILLFLADDLGYGDLGCYGCPDIKTPHIDALAKQGVRLTSYYANGPECTPTRTALMTGRYQQRVGGLECAIGLAGVGRYDDAIRLAEKHDLGLPPEQSVLASSLKAAGYSAAICGKWHLGYDEKFLPSKHGFDYFFGPLGGGIDYFRHNEPGGEHMLYLNDQKVQRDGYATDLIAAAACDFLRRTKDKPFLLYVPFNAPHSPFQGPDDKNLPATEENNFNRGTRATYIKMVERLDDRIGTILRALDETGQAANTLVIFTSDNGGPANSRNDPFSGRKGQTYEGGIRDPCILRWPGQLTAGRESSQVAATFDLTASMLNAAGAKPKPNLLLDGIDIVAHVKESKPDVPRTLFWRQRRGDQTWRGVRDGNWKLVVRQQGTQRTKWLFDLSNDLAERHDLLATHPADANRLTNLLARWEEEAKPSR